MKKNPINKNMNQKGITLINLIITIIVLTIILSITVYSGVNTIKDAQFTKFTTELRIMQTEVNNLYDDYKNNRTIYWNETEYTGDEILNIGKDIDSNAQNTLNKAEIEDITGYRYYDKETIKALQIEGVEREFIINIQTRSVISYKGIKYEGKMYYTIEQVPDNLYNVKKETENAGTATFSAKSSKTGENEWKIEIYNIKYTPTEGGNINKWKVKYKIQGEETWNYSDSTTFLVEEEGLYEIRIYNGNIESENTITVIDLKVGDYITGYTLRDATNSEVSAEITSLNEEVNSLSGYETAQNLTQESNMQWRVLEIDEKTGKPTKLISADKVGSLGLRGAMGYNNAVYLLNKACEVLYSGEKGTARSIIIEDLEEHYSNIGKEVKANYKAEETKLGGQKRFTSSSYRYYPQIAKEENEIGIDTETYIAEDGNTYNTLNTSGIGGSDEGTAPYEGTETKGSAYDQASTNGITVTQTYYNLNGASSLSECYENSAYYNLFHGINDTYWIASRCFVAYSSYSYCDFGVHCASSSKVRGEDLFNSNIHPGSNSHALRPIIELKSNIKAEYVGESSSTGYNTWNIL